MITKDLGDYEIFVDGSITLSNDKKEKYHQCQIQKWVDENGNFTYEEKYYYISEYIYNHNFSDLFTVEFCKEIFKLKNYSIITSLEKKIEISYQVK